MNAPLKPWVPPTRRTCRPMFFDGHGGSGVEPRTRTARYSTAPLTVARPSVSIAWYRPIASASWIIATAFGCATASRSPASTSDPVMPRTVSAARVEVGVALASPHDGVSIASGGVNTGA
jgi:hypothetical protein